MAALPYLSEAEVRARIRAEVERAGGYSALARELGVSVQFVHRCAKGPRPPSGRILELVGIKQAVMTLYLPVEE